MGGYLNRIELPLSWPDLRSATSRRSAGDPGEVASVIWSSGGARTTVTDELFNQQFPRTATKQMAGDCAAQIQ
jgi:hypothetical protein